MFQKKMLVLAALMGATAAAQADVNLYGYLELGVGSYESAGAAPKGVTQVSSGNMMTSFLGFSGSEDLGGGLKAEFVMETFLAPDTGATLGNNAGAFWGRGSFVALTGGFGKVALGKYDNPLFTAGLVYNPFGSSMMFSPTMRHYYGLGNGLANSTFSSALTVDTGFVNSITYETPEMGGFMGTLQWSPKESATAGTKDSFTVSGSYSAGPLGLMAVYSGNGFSDALGTVAPLPSTSRAYAGKQKVWSLNGSYDFGVVKGFLQYTDVDNDNTTVDRKLYQIGATIPVTDMSAVKVSYGELKEDTTPTATTKNKLFSLGYDYTLSKRTGLYAAYNTERHTGLKAGNSYAVGIKHSF